MTSRLLEFLFMAIYWIKALCSSFTVCLFLYSCYALSASLYLQASLVRVLWNILSWLSG